MKDFSKHFSHYISLIGICTATILGYVMFSYDKNFQLALIGAASLSYFVWGIIHHIIHKNLNWQIIIEYAVFACLGFVIGISVTFRS